MRSPKRSLRSLRKIAGLMNDELGQASSVYRQLDEQQNTMQTQQAQLAAFHASYAGFDDCAQRGASGSKPASPAIGAELLQNRYQFVYRLDQALEEIQTRLEENDVALQDAKHAVDDVARRKRGVELMIESATGRLRKSRERREQALSDERAARRNSHRNGADS